MKQSLGQEIKTRELRRHEGGSLRKSGNVSDNIECYSSGLFDEKQSSNVYLGIVLTLGMKTKEKITDLK